MEYLMTNTNILTQPANVKYEQICFDGIDKAGKELIRNYVNILGNYYYILNDRGLISNIAYAKLYNRQYTYDLSKYKDILFVCLTVDKEDWKVRCKLTNEPKIDYEKNVEVYQDTIKFLKANGIKIVEYNTSEMTPYSIAKQIIQDTLENP
jgi:hypothetical protein